MPTDPPFVVHPDTLEPTEARYPAPFDEPALALGRDLGTAAGAARLGAWHDTIPPGRQTSFLHTHLLEEEALVVLSGNPVLEWRPPGGPIQHTPLRPGAYVAFPAGTGIAHSVHNPADAPDNAVILVVGERNPADRLAYPERPAFEAWRTERAPERTWPDFEGPAGLGTPPPYRIETPRLILRPFDPVDVHPLVRGVRGNHARLAPWFPWAKTVPSIDAQLDWIRDRRAAYDRDEDYTLGAFLRSGPLVGAGGMHLRQGPGAVELGYWITAAQEGTGLVSEWVAALTRLSLEVLGFERVLIRCDVHNDRSRAVPIRLGFELDGVARQPCSEGDIERDIQVYALHAPQLADSPCASAELRAWDGAGRRLI